MLKSQYHFAQGFFVNPASSYPVKVYFFALAIGTSASKDGISAGVSAAARAVIAACAAQQLVPAILAQILVALADALLTVDADRRPEKLVQTLQNKDSDLFCAGKSSFWFCRIHAANYTKRNEN